MTRLKDQKTIAVQRIKYTVETLFSYSYNDFIKVSAINAVFQQKDQLDWAYANRMQLSRLTAEDLYEKSPFLDYADDINNPLHIRFLSPAN